MTTPSGGSNPQAAQLWQQAGQDPSKFVQLWQQAHPELPLDQQNPAFINSVVGALQGVDPGGNWASAGTDANGHTDGIQRNGVGYKLISGSNQLLPGLQTYQQAEGSGGGSLGGFGSGGFGSGTFQPVAPFNGLSLADFQGSPGYAWEFQQGIHAIDNKTGSQGTAFTPQNWKAKMNYGVGLASQDYNNAFNRAFTTQGSQFTQGLQTHQTNYNDLYNLASLGKPN